MYKKLFLFLVFLSSLSFSQNKNFSIEDKLIIWKNVYEDSTSILELKKNFRLEFVSDSTGFIKKTNFSDRKIDQLTAEFKIESKKGRYRVSVYNIKFYEEQRVLNSDGISMQTIRETTIEESWIKNDGTIRKSIFGYNVTERLHPHLIDLFKIKLKKDEEW